MSLAAWIATRLPAKTERVEVRRFTNTGPMVPIDLFDQWVRHLGPNPKQGQDCAEGFWWEDICWHARVTRAQRMLDAHIPDRALRVYEDADGVYRCDEVPAHGR